jgi:hypothetical protein
MADKKQKAKGARIAKQIKAAVEDAFANSEKKRRGIRVTDAPTDGWRTLRTILVKRGRNEDVTITVCLSSSRFSWESDSWSIRVKPAWGFSGGYCRIKTRTFRELKSGGFNLDGIAALAIEISDKKAESRNDERAIADSKKARIARIRKALSKNLPKRFKYEQSGESFKIWKSQEYGGATVRVTDFDEDAGLFKVKSLGSFEPDHLVAVLDAIAIGGEL